MNIDEFFEVFTGGNSNVATWTPKAIKEFAEDYHNQQLRLHGVSKSLNMEHNATSVEYAEAIIDMHKNPENSNRDFKIVVLENTIDKLKQDLANI